MRPAQACLAAGNRRSAPCRAHTNRKVERRSGRARTREAGGVELADGGVERAADVDEVLDALVQQPVSAQLGTDLFFGLAGRHELAPGGHVHAVHVGVAHRRARAGQVHLIRQPCASPRLFRQPLHPRSPRWCIRPANWDTIRPCMMTVGWFSSPAVSVSCALQHVRASSNSPSLFAPSVFVCQATRVRRRA